MTAQLLPIHKMRPVGDFHIDPEVVEEYVNAYRNASKDRDFFDLLSPKAILADFSDLGPDTRLANCISEACVRKGAQAIINCANGRHFLCQIVTDEGVWRRLLNGMVYLGAPLNRKSDGLKSTGEKAVEDALVAKLQQEGRRVRRQVRCRAGIADVVTEQAIYEVKDTLSRAAILQALGQVLVYRAAINPDLRPFIAGRKTGCDSETISWAKAAGIDCILVDMDQCS